MSGRRIFQVAKEIDVKSKDIVEKLVEMGFEAKSHMSTISEEAEKKIKDFYSKKEKSKTSSDKKKKEPKKAKETKKQEKKADKKPEDKKAAKKKETKQEDKKEVKKEKKDTKAKETKKAEAPKKQKQQQPKPKKKQPEKKYEPGELGIIELSENTTVRIFASKLKRKTKEIMAKLSEHGVHAGANQIVDFSLLEQIAGEFGYLVEKTEYESEILNELEQPDNEEDLVKRYPVVTFMGHVDHGKTSLLDYIRNSRVAAREAGGITQHIGAYQISIADSKITFLDTPGHEAFTVMRARGAQVTDIVILVVAADEGLKPQTIEAINHAKAAGVGIIVAINKIDKPEANPDLVKRQLLEQELVVEDYGGDIVAVEVSAKTGKGIDDLLEYIHLLAEMLELKANPKARAKGTVIEAKIDKGKGPVATVLIQNGTAKRGNIFSCGFTYGKIRAMFDDMGKQINEAPPSTPIELLGFNDVPMAGDIFYVVDTEQQAKELANAKKLKAEKKAAVSPVKKLSLDDLFKKMEEDQIKELPIVLKCDVQGSVETIDAMLQKLSGDQVKVNVIHKAVGAISDNDILLAASSNAIVIGFHVKANKSTMKLAEREGVEIRIHNIIYEITNEIKKAMEGLLDTETKEEFTGKLQVRQVFKVPKIGFIAGCYVAEGYITRKSLIRVYRDNIMIHEGKLSSLKRFKDDVSEVKQGFECGVGIENFKDLKEGDEIEAYLEKEVAGVLKD